MNAIGQPISRIDGRPKTTGGAHYTADIPIVGVAKSGWGLDQFRDRAKDSLRHHGSFD